MELLIMIDSCKRASADRVTAVIPYFGYARQDRKDEGRVPITAKLVANLIARAGADRVLTMDLHAPQIQGFFDVPVDHLYAAPVLNNHFSERGWEPDEIVVVSPDEGSIKRALGHSKRLGGTLAIVDKRRTSALEVKQSTIIGGPVKGKIALMFDDMISTAGSICGAAQLVHEAGAREIHIGATHGVLCGPAIERLQQAPIQSLAVTNTIPLPSEASLPNLVPLSVARLLAEAIKRIHHDQSISEMFRSRV
jgi:ribose-phosphate pyrophosphokinase